MGIDMKINQGNFQGSTGSQVIIENIEARPVDGPQPSNRHRLHEVLSNVNRQPVP
jgi:hypothetical protein